MGKGKVSGGKNLLYTQFGLPRTMTVREASLQLGISDDTLRRMIHSGMVKAHRIGKKCFRVPVSEVVRLSKGGAK